MRELIGRARADRDPPRILFVPHSGPFSRGIHATIHARLHKETSADELRESFGAFYRDSPFVSISEGPPVLKEVIGTNRVRLGIAIRGRDVVVFSVIDNLTKGAAGGALQWMNRLHRREPTDGLLGVGLGWN